MRLLAGMGPMSRPSISSAQNWTGLSVSAAPWNVVAQTPEALREIQRRQNTLVDAATSY